MGKRKYKLPKPINGCVLWYSARYNVWVNGEGTYAYREYKDPKLNTPLTIYQRKDGSKFLNTKKPQTIELDQLVADCFNPMPLDGNKYELVHKDGNIANCNFLNLMWQPVVSYSPLDTDRTLANGITVNFEGKFYKGKEELPLVKEIGDADTNRIVAIMPYVRFEKKDRYKRSKYVSMDPDILMADAGFVEGNPSKLNRPRIIHVDMDYLNFSYDNLKLVEEDSPEYQEYIKKRQADIDAQTIRLNPNHSNPLVKLSK